MIKHEQRHVVDLVLVAVSLIVLLGLVGYAQPFVIAPLDGAVQLENEVMFSFDRGSHVLVDDSLEFSSPLVVREGETLELEPGVWYWKVEGATESEVRTLTIQGVVALELRSVDGEIEVVNVGNTRLRIKEYRDEVLLGERVVSVSSSAMVSGGVDRMIGGQDG